MTTHDQLYQLRCFISLLLKPMVQPEVSKSIWDAIHFTPLFIADFQHDMDMVEEIINKDYSDRFIDPPEGKGHKARLPQTRLATMRPHCTAEITPPGHRA